MTKRSKRHIPRSTETNQPADRQAGIGRAIRGWIIEGKLRPGDRIKSRQELADHFDTTLMTIQKTISRLEQDGFVESRGWEGTFVAAHPPHLCRVGLLPSPRSDRPGENWGFDQSLVRTAQGVPKPTKVEIYEGVHGHSKQEQDLRRLVLDIQRQCLAGLIIRNVWCIQFPALRRALTQSCLPIVGIVNSSDVPGMKLVRLESARVVDMAVERLVSLGRKRIAMASVNTAADGFWKCFESSCARHGVAAVPWRRFDVDVAHPGSIPPAIHMLSHLSVDERPDALFISDDNAVPLVTSAVREIGGPARDWAVVAHANFPIVTPSSVPALRIGFDSHSILDACIKLIHSAADLPVDMGDSLVNAAQPNVVQIEPVWQQNLIPSVSNLSGKAT